MNFNSSVPADTVLPFSLISKHKITTKATNVVLYKKKKDTLIHLDFCFQPFSSVFGFYLFLEKKKDMSTAANI